MGMIKKSGRRFPRVDLNTEAYLHCNGRKYAARIMNISIGGVFLSMKKHVSLPADVIGVRPSSPIYLQIPKLSFCGACGQIRRTILSGLPQDVRLGVQFNHPRPDIGYRVERFAAVGL